MLLCDEPRFVPWTPDFSSSGRESPEWTKLLCGDLELCNSLEWTPWTAERVQVRLCTACGEGGCAPGNYVQLSLLGEHVLWSPPEIDADDEFEVDQYRQPSVLDDYGAILFPWQQWQQWRERFPKLRSVVSLDRIRREDLAKVWLLEMPQAYRLDDPANVVEMIQSQAYCGSEYALEQIATILKRIITWFQDAPTDSVEGTLRSTSGTDLQPEVVYWDEAGVAEWTPFACQHNDLYLTLGPDWVLDRPLR